MKRLLFLICLLLPGQATAAVPLEITTAIEKINDQRLVIDALTQQIAVEKTVLQSRSRDLQTIIARLYPSIEPPQPNPQPIPPPPSPLATSVRCLFMYDAGTLLTMQQSQLSIMTSNKVRSWLNAHCPLECPTGVCTAEGLNKSPSFRFLPVEVNLESLPLAWKGIAQATASKKMPWMRIIDERAAIRYDAPWPANETDLLQTLETIGGK